MSWAPFVGVFIARISKGRTIREFVMGVLLVPTLVTFLWFSVLGGSALYQEIFGGGGMIAEDGTVSTDTALFQLFDTLPGSTILSVLGILLIVIFFVTSSDSASFVVDMLASGGDPNPPKWSRAFWGCVEGAVAAVLLVVGAQAAAANPDAGIDPLSALQTMAILLALPFSVVLVLLAISTAKALLREQKVRQRKQREWFAERVAEHIESRS
jgi:choline/glycine/proline betaine transport protein